MQYAQNNGGGADGGAVGDRDISMDATQSVSHHAMPWLDYLRMSQSFPCCSNCLIQSSPSISGPIQAEVPVDTMYNILRLMVWVKGHT
jgi:hypothetical protein